jgi:hypothetical protein
VGRLHYPRLVHQLSKIDLAATGRPFALCPGGDHQRIIEEHFDTQIIHRFLLCL